MLRFRSSRAAAILLAAIVLPCTGGCARSMPPGATPAHGARTIRIMSYNIAAGRFGIDSVARVIRAADSDLVGLEEVDVNWAPRSDFRDEARFLADTLHMHVFFAPIYTLRAPSPDRPPRRFGLAILSRYPITDPINHGLTRLSTQSEPAAPRPMPGFPEVTVDVAGTAIHFFATHLDYRADPAVRRRQVADMLALLHATSEPTILVGDLNATPDAAELQPLLHTLNDAWQHQSSPGFTYPANTPQKRIDYVLFSNHFQVIAARVPDVHASDHRPIIATLRLR